jgi:hypothetical protein
MEPQQRRTRSRAGFVLQDGGGPNRIEVRMHEETVWLSQLAMAELFQTSKQNISLHIKNILTEAELKENSVVKEYLTTASDGKKYQTKLYSLEMIIAVGYRVKSSRGTQFRQWATERLREYVIKGFTLDDKRLKQGGNRARYFQEQEPETSMTAPNIDSNFLRI